MADTESIDTVSRGGWRSYGGLWLRGGGDIPSKGGEYLYQYTHVGEKSPYTQLAEQFRAGTNRGWWTVFTELVADEDNSIAVGDADVLVGLFLGKRCEHKKKRVLGEGGGGDDGWRLEYQQLEVLYQEEVDSHKATLADLEDARDKIRRLEKKVTRLQAAVDGQQE